MTKTLLLCCLVFIVSSCSTENSNDKHPAEIIVFDYLTALDNSDFKQALKLNSKQSINKNFVSVNKYISLEGSLPTPINDYLELEQVQNMDKDLLVLNLIGLNDHYSRNVTYDDLPYLQFEVIGSVKEDDETQHVLVRRKNKINKEYIESFRAVIEDSQWKLEIGSLAGIINPY
jgi:hypothetical protein